MKTRLDIDTNTLIRFWLVVFGIAFIILALYLARTALVIIGTALFLALALSKPVALIDHRLPGKNRLVATAIAFVTVVGIIAAVVTLVIPPIAEQTGKFVESAPKMVEQLSQQWAGFGHFAEKYNIKPQVDSAIEGLKNNTSGMAANAGKNFIEGLGSVFSLSASLLLVLVLTFLMLVEGPTWIKRFWALYNDKKRRLAHQELADKMYNVVTGYVTGQLTVSGIGAALAGLTVFAMSLVFNVPANLAFVTIAVCFLLSLIPMFGATIAGVIIAALLAFNDWGAGLAFIVYFMIYQQVENNFISPTIQAKRVELSALTVLVSVTIGLYVFGVAGGIISIPIAGCINVWIEYYFNHKNKSLKMVRE